MNQYEEDLLASIEEVEKAKALQAQVTFCHRVSMAIIAAIQTRHQGDDYYIAEKTEFYGNIESKYEAIMVAAHKLDPETFDMAMDNLRIPNSRELQKALSALYPVI